MSVTVRRYESHLAATADWLLRSVARGRGGSCAHFSPLLGWSRPYPETTGYLIPTLLRLHERLRDRDLQGTAIRLGRWLLSIQLDDGAWQSGLFPSRRRPRASVFNTGQILKGLAALHRVTGERVWLDAARRAADWLARGVSQHGDWGGGDYRAPQTPSYYTHVAWPMLEVWSLSGDDAVRRAAERVLRFVLARRRRDGWFEGWSFKESWPACTHTIAYTLRGLLESARLVDNWTAYGEPAVPALERLARHAELTGGRLAGAYAEGWKGVTSYSCLTGNVQLALCLLVREERDRDLRLVNAAAKLTDYVCSRQRLGHALSAIRGAVAGSSPPWGSYMTLRYPNWAAKYHCDALMMLNDRVRQERERLSCA